MQLVSFIGQEAARNKSDKYMSFWADIPEENKIIRALVDIGVSRGIASASSVKKFVFTSFLPRPT